MTVDKLTPQDILGFDLDGVLIDHTENKILLASQLGFQLNPEQTRSDIIHNFIPWESAKKLKDSLYNDRRYALSPPLMKDANTVLAAIQNRKIEYFLISRRHVPKLAVKLMEKRGLWPKFFNETNTHFVSKREDKNTKAVELGITRYIDDELKVLDVLTDVKYKYLFDPFDSPVKTDPYPIINSWSEFQYLLLK